LNSDAKAPLSYPFLLAEAGDDASENHAWSYLTLSADNRHLVSMWHR
jgi:hypothetical protein